jgi:hypothetical protein
VTGRRLPAVRDGGSKGDSVGSSRHKESVAADRQSLPDARTGYERVEVRPITRGRCALTTSVARGGSTLRRGRRRDSRLARLGAAVLVACALFASVLTGRASAAEWFWQGYLPINYNGNCVWYYYQASCSWWAYWSYHGTTLANGPLTKSLTGFENYKHDPWSVDLSRAISRWQPKLLLDVRIAQSTGYMVGI